MDVYPVADGFLVVSAGVIGRPSPRSEQHAFPANPERLNDDMRKGGGARKLEKKHGDGNGVQDHVMAPHVCGLAELAQKCTLPGHGGRPVLHAACRASHQRRRARGQPLGVAVLKERLPRDSPNDPQPSGHWAKCSQLPFRTREQRQWPSHSFLRGVRLADPAIARSRAALSRVDGCQSASL